MTLIIERAFCRDLSLLKLHVPQGARNYLIILHYLFVSMIQILISIHVFFFLTWKFYIIFLDFNVITFF